MYFLKWTSSPVASRNHPTVTLAPVVIRLILLALVHAGSSINDFRLITYSDLSKDMKEFSHPGIGHYSQIIFDLSRYQVIVGARDYLFRLNIDDLMKLEESEWTSRRNVVNMCKQKGQSSEDCRNYVKVLHLRGDKILACGTNSFNPRCTWRPADDLKTIDENFSGVGKCPYSPHENITTLLTTSGDYYLAGAVDFSSRDHAIYRIMGDSPVIRTVQYNSKWLNDPDFVGSFDADDFTYFFFRETAVEYSNCGQVIYSRVARICKNDAGGEFVLKNRWTTFLKARLNCSLGSGDFPFYFNEIQSVFYVESDRMFYATFNTPINSIYGSAVCSFNLSSIDGAFDGPFKYQEDTKSLWRQKKSNLGSHFKCKMPVDAESILDSQRYQLMHTSVSSSTSRPIFFEELSRFGHVVVDVVRTKRHHERGVHVMFVTTLEGTIRKLSIHPLTKNTCLVEEIQPFQRKYGIRNLERILTVKILPESKSLFIGTDKSVKKIALHRCSRFKTRISCIHARDPYCGWHSHQLSCTTAPHGNPSSSFWHQDIGSSCPVLSDPVDGEWGDWTHWEQCLQTGVRPKSSARNFDRCLCRSRKCNSPPPMNGGSLCTGHNHEVTNCTRNGGWTEWSAWSACSQSCGMAVKTRRRTCGNPKPSFGGRICVGPEREEIFCSMNPPCPIPRPPKIDGQWSEFGPWQRCSVHCGGGIQVRRRRCDSPSPKNGGLQCGGCNLEYRPCNSHTCPETRRSTNWTPWLRDLNATSNSGYYESRFRFNCLAPIPDSRLIRFGQMKSEKRFCYSDSRGCSNLDGLDVDGGWSKWSSWSNCSRSCGHGGGIQTRNRKCKDPPPAGNGNDCQGAFTEERMCNTKPCKDLTPPAGEWSAWSVCDKHNQQHRRRNCESVDRFGSVACKDGPNDQTRVCLTFDKANINLASYGDLGKNTVPSPSSSAHRATTSKDRTTVRSEYLVAGCICGFILGVAVGGLVMYQYVKRTGSLRERPKLDSNYISAKDNLYVTNFELHSKSLNGTLRKALAGQAATLKRNGLQQYSNGHVRASYLDELKNFDC